MWSRLESLPVLVMGTALTKTCATFGLTFFLATLAGPPQREPAPVALKTVLIPVKNRNIDEVADLLRMLKGRRGSFGVSPSRHAVRITDLPSNVYRMTRFLHAVDESNVPGQAIWFIHVSSSATDVAQKLTEVLDGDPESGATLAKIFPAEREKLLIIVGNEAAYSRIIRMRPNGCPNPPPRPDDRPVELPIQSHGR